MESVKHESDSFFADLKVGVVIPAAGSGQRMGGRSKQFLQLAGLPVLKHVLNMFKNRSWVIDIVVSLPQAQYEEPPEWLSEEPEVRTVLGGASRRDSVWNAIQTFSDDLDLILVHDGARPLTPQKTILDCVNLAANGFGAVAGVRVVDTLKKTDNADRVLGTQEREDLWRAQTPQVFPYTVLLDAYQKAIQNNFDASDDSIIVEKVGGQVRMVESSPLNFKVTVPADLDFAEAVLNYYRSRTG